MTNPDSLTQWDRLLLMAASVENLGPQTNLRYANSARVVRRALSWSGKMSDDDEAAWKLHEFFPAIRECCDALAQRIRNDPADTALFEGFGNWGSDTEDPAFPHFTSCRLTPRGMQLAAQLL